jgi:DNA helicase-2/ATP-dependent DNA helicase PcrA
MAETFLFFGPPGSGKSTTIVDEANRAVQAYSERNGCDPADCREVLITSLTRAAKGEIRKRKNQGMLLDPSCVSTLHALAWKACGRPKLIHSKGALDDWNNSCSNPHWTLASLTHRSNSDEGLFGEQDGVMRGDRLYEETSKMRAKMIPREEWPDELIDFHDSFGAWKRASGFADFQDCIERAAETTDEAPGSPRVIFVDEAQDHDRSQFHLLKHWAKGIDKLVVVGDPLQAIYTWRGSDPDAFYELPCQWKRTLPYPAGPTWRVPEAVREQAIAVAQEIDVLEEGRNRMAMDYRPRELTTELEARGYTQSGFVHSIETSFSTDSGAEIALSNARRHLDEGRSVMFLATCAYMLNPLMRLMRERGIAYYNPFITTANSFNPIEYTTPGGTGRRIRAFLRPSEKLFGEDARIWTYEEAYAWVDLIKAEGVLRHGAKGKLRQLAEKRPGRYAQLDQRAMTTLFEPDALNELDAALEAGDLSWLMNRLTAGAITEKPRRYLEGLLAASGSQAIVEDPRVIVGTIHSVKGGEADVVYVSNELSRAGERSYAHCELDTLRAFYVAVTRAKEGLVMCGDFRRGRMGFRWPQG